MDVTYIRCGMSLAPRETTSESPFTLSKLEIRMKYSGPGMPHFFLDLLDDGVEVPHDSDGLRLGDMEARPYQNIQCLRGCQGRTPDRQFPAHVADQNTRRA